MFFSKNVYLQEVNKMANNTNRKLVPEAMSALDKFKYEVASDLAVKNIFDKSLATSFIFMLFFYFLFSYHLIH